MSETHPRQVGPDYADLPLDSTGAQLYPHLDGTATVYVLRMGLDADLTACIGPLPLALAEALLAVVAAGQCELGSTDEARGFPRAIRNSPLFGTIPVWETAE